MNKYIYAFHVAFSLFSYTVEYVSITIYLIISSKNVQMLNHLKDMRFTFVLFLLCIVKHSTAWLI